jgi:hypothetical protein
MAGPGKKSYCSCPSECTAHVRVVALEAGVTPARYSRVENGHMPDPKTFASLCKWLSRDPRDFLGIETTETAVNRPKAVVHFKKKKTVQIETAKALGELNSPGAKGCSSC